MIADDAGETALLADFAASARAAQIPAEVVERARLHVLDTLGVALAGAGEPQGTIPLKVLHEADGSGACSVFGSALRLPPGNAALVNGTAAHALDYDDWQLPWHGHPTAIFFPALLALGELRKYSGERLLCAYAVAMVAGHALGSAVQPQHHERGWHSTATVGAVAAAAGCANLLGLDPVRARHAIALGATQAAGVHRNFGTMAKPLQPGLAARAGVLAALLADGGFEAGSVMLEGRLGFAEVYSRGDRFDAGAFRRAFDDPFRAAFAGLNLKPYPSCGATHPAIDGVLGLMAANGLRPGDVAKIEGVLNPLATVVLAHSRPQTGIEGKFSFEYCMAAAVLDGAVGAAQFTDERAADPRIRDLASRVEKRGDPEIDPHGNYSTRVSVTLRDGRVLSDYVTAALGTPEKPLEAAAVEEKFRACARMQIGNPEIERLLEMIRSFERLDSVREIGGVMRSGLPK